MKKQSLFNKNFYKKRKGSTLIFVIFFMVIFLSFAALAVDGTIIFTQRLKLQNKTEATVLATAAEFYQIKSVSEIKQTATNTFNLLKMDGLKEAKIVSQTGIDTSSSNIDDDVIVDVSSKKVTMYTSIIAQPYFLTFMGVSGVKLEAKASAISEELPVTANYSGINWLNVSAAYLSDIISKKGVRDTAIATPLGNLGTGSASYSLIGVPYYNLINSDTNNKPLSLGPGGFITIKLPAPIIDKSGPDLYIDELGVNGAMEGYMVFAGLDNNPQKPYVNQENTGDGISWKNISCSGTSALGISSPIFNQSTDNLGYQDKIYGSAYFDIGNSCTGGLSMAKYIRIVDDNRENGFVSKDGETFYKAMLYGEASTTTSGADIDYIKVLNHVRLVPMN